ncbi:hypothetical protein NQ314_014790 [Rhamnusium bicolor]|uniref:T-complex-associated testis-expressed protein 1 n=1 Tax=Rhamnusium bicolor TaxID=1586634 RepID=A0AAV8X0X1_9CUCU|nr:hypothetical protein NQ314_014790 [Rhamnusium bicolor]
MRIPHIINENTLLEYEPSPESLDLIGEDERKLVAEDFQWNKDHCAPLPDYCDEIYWQRRYEAKFGLVTNRKPEYWTWKILYLERHIQKILEEAQPQYKDEETFDEILDLCAPYIRRVIVSQLQCWKPPLTMDPEDIPDANGSFYKRRNIKKDIFSIEFVILTYENCIGMNDVFDDFSWNMFKLSVADCRNLGIAILELKQIKILRIHRSKLEYKHCQALMQSLVLNRTLVELDLSNCQIGDLGALCVAKVLEGHPTLKKLNLSNNYIGQIGSEGIGFSMLEHNCAQLEVLNMRLNPLKKDGAMGIMRALVRCSIPEELSMSGCLFDEDTPIKVCQMIKVNGSLKKLDVSGNWFGEDGGEALVEALEENSTLEWLDVRDTDITPEQDIKIRKLLVRNRTGVYEMDEEIQSLEEEEETEEKVIAETDYNKDEEESPENA